MHRLFAARPRPGLLIDVLIAGAAWGGTLAVVSHGFTVVPGSSPGSGDLDAVSGLLAACASLPLIAWRRNAFGVLVLTATAGALLGGLGYPVGVPFGATVALYLLAATRTERDPWTPRTTAAVLALMAIYLSATGLAHGGFPGSQLFHTALAGGAAWFAGERTRLQRDHIAELQDRARRAEREAEQERMLAVAEERARIARDLHDSAGHAMNVIAVRAGAARLSLNGTSDGARDAFEAIEELARQTVGEIDQLVGTLRDDRAETEPIATPPGLASVDTLLAHHAATGLDVDLTASGATRPLATTIDQAAYRVLQEALTNAARHGTGTAKVDLGFGENALDLTVVNPVPDDRAARSGGGHGLIGMRERVTLLGGSLGADRVNGAFRLRAHLPYEPHEAHRP